MTASGRYVEQRLGDLDALTLFAILRLRVDVFVVEQACAYPELDDADAAATTLHCWLAAHVGPDAGGPTAPSTPGAYLRLLREPDLPQRIGRVVTAPASRGQGLAALLMREVMSRHPGPTTLEAQSHLVGWYGRFGFEPCGPEYVEDGIPHTPMVSLPSPS